MLDRSERQKEKSSLRGEADGHPHIAQLIGTFDGGGAERVAYNLAVGLHDVGVRSTGIAMRQLGRFPDARPDVDWVALTASPGWIGRVGLVLRLRRWIRDARPDLIWVHGTGTLLGTTVAMISLRNRPRIWFTWHCPESVLAGGLLRRHALLWAINKCERLFAPSREIAEVLGTSTGRPERVSVFTNGVPEIECTNGLMSDPPTIVWAARIAPTKDPQILVRAATKLKSLGLRFRIILAGSAPHYLEWYGLQIRDFINQHGLRDCIETPGWVDDVPSLYRHAAIGVQTSETEGLSMTLLEQMMAGLAIVATDVGDTAIAIEHEKNGLLIPPGDDQALIEALTRVITDRDLRMRLGRNARADAIQRFTCRAMAEGALEII